MIGRPLLPVRAEPCTAKHFRITDIDGLAKPRCRCLKKDDRWSRWRKASADLLAEWNGNGSERIDIEADIPRLDNPFGESRIVFHDTPGTNNALNESRSDLVQTILREAGSPHILFVLNSTLAGVRDEETALSDVLRYGKARGMRPRVVFAVNKIDEFDPERENVKLHLAKCRHQLTERGFHNPLVVPCMAELSLEIRTILQEHSSAAETLLSPRRQKALFNRLESLVASSLEHEASILHTPRYLRYLKSAKQQYGEREDRGTVTLAGRPISRRKLAHADIMTGVPVLEKILESEHESSVARKLRIRKGKDTC